MKKVLDYILIFISTITVLFCMLLISAKIPRSAIENNLKDSLDFYRIHPGLEIKNNKYLYTYTHYYADTRKLDIIYCIDTNDVLKSVLWSNYYQEVKRDTNQDFIKTVENDFEPNTDYLRYWHGSMLFLRPLLVLFTMPQIYLINAILIYLLLLILIIVMFKKSKKLAIAFTLSLILIAIWCVPKCIEYSVTFYIYIIATLIALKLDKKETDIDKANRNLFRLFLITGICTTFFDFLTTEILTLFIPVIVIILVRYEEKRMNSFKEILLFVLKAGFLWSMGYALTWGAKWLIASIVLKINAIDYIKGNLLLRIGGNKLGKKGIGLCRNALIKNIRAIPLNTYISIKWYKWQVKSAMGAFLAIVLMFIKWKELKNKKYLIPMLLIAMTPYLRYFVLAQHSRNHAMFTFRDQIITIMVLIYIVIDNWNKDLMFKDVPIFKKKA